MKQIKLLNMAVENFKGIKSFEVNFNDGVTTIAGPNEAGKTTTADAFFWCLFGKNSEFDSKFGIKPLDADNNEIHNLTTAVKVTLDVDGTVKTFARKMEEKWGRKRGDTEDTLIGHEYSYEVDSAQVKAGEYAAEVDILCNEDDFKILSSSSYFNEKMHWQDRRALLSALVDGTTIEIVSEKRKYKAIVDDVVRYGYGKTLAMYQGQLRDLNKQGDAFQARIDEQSRNILSADTDTARLEQERTEIKQQIDKLRKQATPSETAEAARLRSELKIVQTQLDKALDEAYQTQEAKREAVNNLAELSIKIDEAKGQIKSIREQIENKQKERESLISDIRGKLRDNYLELKAQTFDETTCPVCGQELPPDQLAEKREKWAEDRESRMGQITKTVAQNRELADQLLSDSEKLQSQLTSISQLPWAKQLEDAQAEVEKANAAFTVADNRVKELQGKRKAIQQQIETETQTDDQPDVTDQINHLQEAFDQISKQLAAWDQSEKAKARVQELAEEKAKAGQLRIEVEGKIDLLNELQLDYINTIDADINKLFGKNVKVKLFNGQLNGGFKETCEVLVKSKEGALVPYGDANTAGQINAGLEVVRAISRLKGIQLPVWVDHAESVGSITETGAQQVHLKFVKTYRELTVM
jgi:DNA repair exonuclease SbcCD ATPase subunit